jgi:hypothetical protein
LKETASLAAVSLKPFPLMVTWVESGPSAGFMVLMVSGVGDGGLDWVLVLWQLTEIRAHASVQMRAIGLVVDMSSMVK